MFTVSLIARCLNWVMYLASLTQSTPEQLFQNSPIYMVDLAASIIVWAVLYYFVFEMKIVRDKIGSMTHTQYGKALRETLRIRSGVLITLSILMSTVFVT
jgi:hypothetical protein